MQATAQSKFKRRLERLNAPGYAHLKLLSRFLAVYFVAFCAGILGFYFSGIPFSDALNSRISGNFSYLFADCAGISDCARVVLLCALPDVLNFAIVFISAFTMFSFFSCAIAACLRGLAFGFSVGYLCLAVAGEVLRIGHFEIAFLAFLILNVLGTAALTVFSAKAVMFSYDCRSGRCGRRKTASFAVSALVLLGALVILALVRCIFSAIYIF